MENDDKRYSGGNGMARPLFPEEIVSLKKLFSGDRILWVIIAALIVFSTLISLSATAVKSYSEGREVSYYFIKHVRFLLAGLLAMWITSRFNYQFFYRFTTFAFIASLGLVGLTFFSATTSSVNEAHRTAKILGFEFQPADFLKVALVMVMARILARRQKDIYKLALLPDLTPGGWRRNRRRNLDILFDSTLPILFPVAIACLFMFRGGLTTPAMTFMTCWIMLYIGRVKGGQLWKLMFIVVMLATLAVGTMAAFGVGRARTQVNRITQFVGAEPVFKSGRTLTKEEAEQREKDKALQGEMAKVSIASGGPFGVGPGNSTIRRALPLPFSDFAYAFVVEEYGMVGAFILLMLYLWLFFRSIMIFQRCGTAYPSFLVLGLGLLLTIQAFVNMLVSVRLFPITGQNLPLVSAGGTSIILTGITLGMILGVSRQMEEKTIDTPKGESLLDKN